jgi:hypothetical protein
VGPASAGPCRLRPHPTLHNPSPSPAPRAGKPLGEPARASSNRPPAVTASRRRADGSGVENGARHWEIAYRGFGDAWYRLGWSEGKSAESALQSWVEDGAHAVLRGTYGVRLPGESEWQLFRIDPSGAVYPGEPGLDHEPSA